MSCTDDLPRLSQNSSTPFKSSQPHLAQGSENQPCTNLASHRSVPNNEQSDASATESKRPVMQENVSFDAGPESPEHSAAVLTHSQYEVASDHPINGKSPPGSVHFVLQTDGSEHASVDFIDVPHPQGPTPSFPNTTSASRRRRSLLLGKNLQMMPPPAEQDDLQEQSSTSSDRDVFWRWNAYMRKQSRLMASLSKATQLRRQCLELRRRFNHETFSKSMSMSEKVLQGDEPDSGESFGEESLDVSTLMQLELRLDRLDEQLVRDSDDAVEAAPRVLNRMQKRLPVFLARHQIDFRGDSTSTSDETEADFEPHLDAPAAELLKKQREVDYLEDEILVLRVDRNRIEDANKAVHYDSPSDADVEAKSLADIDKKIDDAFSRLKSAEAELESSRDTSTREMATTLQGEVDHLSELILSSNVVDKAADRTSNTASNANTSVPQATMLVAQPNEPEIETFPETSTDSDEAG